MNENQKRIKLQLQSAPMVFSAFCIINFLHSCTNTCTYTCVLICTHWLGDLQTCNKISEVPLKAPDTKPPFDANQIADQMLYYDIYAVKEQPEWRKKLIKEHGPAGVSYDGYNNYASAAIWEWDWSSFGDWTNV